MKWPRPQWSNKPHPGQPPDGRHRTSLRPKLVCIASPPWSANARVGRRVFLLRAPGCCLSVKKTARGLLRPHRLRAYQWVLRITQELRADSTPRSRARQPLLSVGIQPPLWTLRSAAAGPATRTTTDQRLKPDPRWRQAQNIPPIHTPFPLSRSAKKNEHFLGIVPAATLWQPTPPCFAPCSTQIGPGRQGPNSNARLTRSRTTNQRGSPVYSSGSGLPPPCAHSRIMAHPNPYLSKPN